MWRRLAQANSWASGLWQPYGVIERCHFAGYQETGAGRHDGICLRTCWCPGLNHTSELRFVFCDLLVPCCAPPCVWSTALLFTGELKKGISIPWEWVDKKTEPSRLLFPYDLRFFLGPQKAGYPLLLYKDFSAWEVHSVRILPGGQSLISFLKEVEPEETIVSKDWHTADPQSIWEIVPYIKDLTSCRCLIQTNTYRFYLKAETSERGVRHWSDIIKKKKKILAMHNFSVK